jgi:hypothetical protein
MHLLIKNRARMLAPDNQVVVAVQKLNRVIGAAPVNGIDKIQARPTSQKA